ncbi:single-stranded DNA-binding protein [Sulfurimonas sp. SAG-AH-194-I05]|nr:single-stranded DNA-binding protein [Sulfurimonas sp. SAG-AH-194-I05]MDF1875674.1 single-stranded DNA-binding protein [Sulfurimonas sp. SAG-AH-194-I05]
MYNKIILVGNLTRDIEIKYSQGGMAIAKTAIATSRKFKSNTGEQKEEVCFVDITFFGRSAEVANQYLRKGSKILVEGKLVFEQWTDQNGQKKSKHGVTVDIMQMLGSKDTSGYGAGPEQNSVNNSGETYKPRDNTQSTPPPTYDTSNSNPPPRQQEVPSIDIDEDDIPF